MRNILLSIALGANLFLGDSFGYERQRGEQHHVSGARTVTFNVFCKYKSVIESARYDKCFAMAVFEKEVTRHGKEIEDDSEYPFNPVFEAECDGVMLYNNSGRRFTDYDGTRIQGEVGPYPAIVLPTGALRDGRRSVRSRLELREEHSDEAYQGVCQIYTGNQ